MSKDKSLSQLASFLAFLVWVFYQLLRLSVGLVLHPYRTVREIMRGVWFVPLVLWPLALLVWIFVTGRIAAWVIDVPVSFRDVIGVGFATLILSLCLWQALLFYLTLRFWLGFKR